MTAKNNHDHDDPHVSVKQLQEFLLKKQWRPGNSTSNVDSTCPTAWPLAQNRKECCGRTIASITYASENNNISASSLCESQEQQLRMQGAYGLQGKRFFFIGDSVGHQWLNSMLLDAHRHHQHRLFHNNTNIWAEYLNKSTSFYEYDERGFCAFPFQVMNMSSIWTSAPSIVSAAYPNFLCPPTYTRALYRQCCPKGSPISYTGAISVKLNETHPDIVIAHLGVHYHSVSNFPTVLNKMLMALGNYSALNPNTLVLFLKSLPQHFDSPNGSGSYDGFHQAVNRSAWQCYPLNSSQIGIDLLLGDISVSTGMHNFNRIARRAVEEMQGGVQWLSSNSVIMGFRHDGHTGVQYPRYTDCTHFCYAPNLWQPAIDPFYHAVDDWLSSASS